MEVFSHSSWPCNANGSSMVRLPLLGEDPLLGGVSDRQFCCWGLWCPESFPKGLPWDQGSALQGFVPRFGKSSICPGLPHLVASNCQDMESYQEFFLWLQLEDHLERQVAHSFVQQETGREALPVPAKKNMVIPRLGLCDLVFTSIYSSASVGSQQSKAFLPLAFGIFLRVTMAPLVAETPAFETCLRNGVSVQCWNTLISISIGEWQVKWFQKTCCKTCMTMKYQRCLLHHSDRLPNCSRSKLKSLFRHCVITCNLKLRKQRRSMWAPWRNPVLLPRHPRERRRKAKKWWHPAQVQRKRPGGEEARACQDREGRESFRGCWRELRDDFNETGCLSHQAIKIGFPSWVTD